MGFPTGPSTKVPPLFLPYSSVNDTPPPTHTFTNPFRRRLCACNGFVCIYNAKKKNTRIYIQLFSCRKFKRDSTQFKMGCHFSQVPIHNDLRVSVLFCNSAGVVINHKNQTSTYLHLNLKRRNFSQVCDEHDVISA
jgi:hypothetical protein